MKFISKAPLRLGLAGGGTDVSPYSDIYGGAILNATIDLYATVVIIPRDDNKVVIHARNNGVKMVFEAQERIEEVQDLKLQIGVYNRIVKEFSKRPLACEIISSIDAPTGSGLGTSSTLVVATIGAFVEWLKLPLGEYDIAQLAVSIERQELKMAGGKQDQYAATFGGVNFMEFHEKNRVVVNPLRIKQEVLRELEYHLLLFYTQTSRESSRIIETQKENLERKSEEVINATHRLKEQAYKMKEAILKDELHRIGSILHNAWGHKKKLATGITNATLDEIYKTAIDAGASGGKISGAGGGGFIMFFCPGNSRYEVIEALKEKESVYQRYCFQKEGLLSWTSEL